MIYKCNYSLLNIVEDFAYEYYMKFWDNNAKNDD